MIIKFLYDHTDNNKFVLELLKNCKKGVKVNYDKIVACQKFTKAIGRYTEASLIKELEKKGIKEDLLHILQLSQQFKTEVM